MAKQRAKKSEEVRLVPRSGWLDRISRQLQQLEIKPLDPRKLAPIDQSEAFLQDWKGATAPQLNQLLRALDIDPASPTSWRDGFLVLAILDYGVGHVVLKPSRTNKNAAKWSREHDLALYREMGILKRQGLSESAAIKKLAADRRTRQLFPYKAQNRPGSKFSEREKCEQALRAHWGKIKGWIWVAEALFPEVPEDFRPPPLGKSKTPNSGTS
jgi:hypothetical protein